MPIKKRTIHPAPANDAKINMRSEFFVCSETAKSIKIHGDSNQRLEAFTMAKQMNRERILRREEPIYFWCLRSELETIKQNRARLAANMPR